MSVAPAPPANAAPAGDEGLSSALRVSVMRLARRLRLERSSEDLSLNQLSVLGTLLRSGELTLGELAAIERVKPPSITRTVNCLVEAGLVARRPHATDGRQVIVELTDLAREVLDEDRRRRDLWLAQRLDELGPADRQLLGRVAHSSTSWLGRDHLRHVPAETSMRTTFAALRLRNYRLFATGSLVSNIGTWMQRIAQDWLVLTLTGSAGALGLTTGLQFLPILLFSPIAGVLADRFPKRRILALTQVALGGTAGILGLLAITGWVTVWHVYVIAFLFGIGTAIDTPARQAFVHEMVRRDQLPNAVGLNSASFNLGRVIGPAIAGGLIALLGSGVAATGWVIMLNAASYFAVIVSLVRMRPEELFTTPLVPRSRGQLRDGIRYVRGRPDIMLVMAVVFCAGTFGLNFQMTTALMATEVYGKGAGEYGILGSVLAIGSLTGSLMAARRVASRQRLVIGAGVAFGIAVTVVGLMPSYLTFALFLPVCGFAALTLITSANSFVQLAADAHMRGRVMALYMAIFMGGTPVGAPTLGWIAEHFGARWTLIGGGALTVIGTITAAVTFGRRQSVVITPRMRPRPHLAVGSREAAIVTETIAA